MNVATIQPMSPASASAQGAAVAGGQPAVFASMLDDAAAASADSAAAISAAQGLPIGVYDFTRITPRQMTVAGRALIVEGRVGAAGLAGAMTLAAAVTGEAGDRPVDMFAYLSHEASLNEKTVGGMTAAFEQRASIAALTRVQGATGVAITYDDRYPGAPKTPTAAEIDAKLSAAIEAFRKEASLTPAQRIRRDVLKDKDLTEEQLKSMPAEQREIAEKAIGEEVARRLTLTGAASKGVTAVEPAPDAVMAIRPSSRAERPADA